MGIIEMIKRTCSCDEKTAREYLESEVNNLRELNEFEDLRNSDLEIACNNLGLDYDYVEYFIRRLAMC